MPVLLHQDINPNATFFLDAINPFGVTLQQAYDAATTVPQLTALVADPLTIRGAGVGDVFAVQDSTSADHIRVASGGISLGTAGRRHQLITRSDETGRFGTELWPDDFTISTATGVSNTAFYTLAARTITLNIPGGGGVGNDIAPAGMNFAHTARFEDQGFLFASQLLINAAVQVECATATVGPLYLFLDQYNTYADGVVATCSQHNCIRAQPRWGPNLSGGSITQTSVELFFAALTVDATVGSASITTANVLAIKGVTLTAGGTVGTYNGIDIVNIVGPTTIRGINSAMSNGTFINHTGTAGSSFAGFIQLNDAVELRLGSSTGTDVALSRQGADTLRMAGAESLDWDFGTTNNVRITSPSGASLNIDTQEVAFGPGVTANGVNNWVFAFAPGLRSTNLAGDYSEVLFTSSTAITIGHAITNFATWTINAPTIVLGGGSITNAANVLIQTSMSQGTNRYGLLITSNPSGGTLNYALRVTNGDVRFDARTDINNPIALGGGAAATLGTIGATGPTVAAQNQWLEIDIGGVAHWIPVWI